MWENLDLTVEMVGKAGFYHEHVIVVHYDTPKWRAKTIARKVSSKGILRPSRGIMGCILEKKNSCGGYVDILQYTG